MTAPLDPAWLTHPTASNDPTFELGTQFQTDRDDLRLSNALVQSPDFVVDFILDRTLSPAMEAFGLQATTLIDPACGPGHFLCAGFMRLAAAWWSLKPADVELSTRERMALAQLALDQVSGVDVDTGCCDLARHRLGVLASEFAGVPNGSYAWAVDVAAADSLLHGPDSDGNLPDLGHSCEDRDCDHAQVILGRTYAAVVANPPYIAGARMGPVKNEAYRRRYRTCHRQYSLSVPFMELCFLLAHDGQMNPPVDLGQMELFA